MSNQLSKTQKKHSRHAYGTSVLRATLAAFLCHMHSLLWMVGVKYDLQKGTFFAKIHITTPAAPLLQAYQGGFFFLFPKNLNMDADLLRWLSSPKPRLVLPPIGGKLRPNSTCHSKNRQAACGGMAGLNLPMHMSSITIVSGRAA